jgi:hypothetical protein
VLEGNEALTWEQERDSKVRLIKSFVGQTINLLANYIDYKESPMAIQALINEAK